MITRQPEIRLVRCDALGHLTEPIGDVSETFYDHVRGMIDLYAEIGYARPWVSYAAVLQARVVGGGAFVGPPTNGAAEVAFFTLAPYERRDFETAIVRALLDIAAREEPGIKVYTKTRPQCSWASQVMRRLTFGWAPARHWQLTEATWLWVEH